MTRRPHLFAKILAGAIACSAMTCISAPAFAQDAKAERTAPVPAPPTKPPSHLLGTVMCFVLGAMIIGVNFIPSKRGHQD